MDIFARKTISLEQQIMKSIPVLLPIANLIICIAVFLTHKYAETAPRSVWLSFIIIQLGISTYCGILIKRFHFGANCDELTGLYSRRYLNSRLGEEIERAKRTHSSFSLVFIDTDNFKAVNDTYGHLTGDKVLRKLGEILKSNTRSIDIVARWGGEEFAIIMPETNLDGAITFAERLRRTVENYDFGFRVTISLGVVSPHEEITIDELLTRADIALYAAKEKKNRVVNYSKLIEGLN